MPFEGVGDIVFCNETFLEGDKYLFLPQRLTELLISTESTESEVTEAVVNQMLQDQIEQSYKAATPECQQLFDAYVCNSIFFSIENKSGNYSLPSPLCSKECMILTTHCPILWQAFIETEIGQYASCDNTGRLLEPLPYCCHGATSTDSSTSNVIGIAVGVSVAIILLLALSALVAVVIFMIIRKYRHLKTILHGLAHTHTHTVNL